MASDEIFAWSPGTPPCTPPDSVCTQSVGSSPRPRTDDATQAYTTDDATQAYTTDDATQAYTTDDALETIQCNAVAAAERASEDFQQALDGTPEARRSLKRKHSAEDTATTVDESAWYFAEEHLQDVIAFIQNYHGPRDTHMIDLFSASESGFDTFVRAGFRAQAYDITNDKQDDVTTEKGFYRMLRLFLGLLPGGLILGGPPCSLYAFFSSSLHRRTIARPLGNTTHVKVRLSNLIVSNMCVAMKHVLHRGIKIIIEQPKSSMMFAHPAMEMLQSGPEQTWLHVHTFMCRFDHPLPVPTVLVTNLKAARLLARGMGHQDFRKLKAQAAENNKVFVRYTPAGVAGVGRFCEYTPGAGVSSKYTVAFCEAVLAAWERHFRMIDHAA